MVGVNMCTYHEIDGTPCKAAATHIFFTVARRRIMCCERHYKTLTRWNERLDRG